MKVGLQRVVSMIAILAIMAMAPAAAFAGGPFSNVESTEDGYATYDSDMINIEGVTQTGDGVYVAVLDTGLVPNWRDYFPEERIATNLGRGFYQPVTFKAGSEDGCELGIAVGRLTQSTWIGSASSTHGTHVASTIIGYFYRNNTDAAAGYPLPPIMVRGIAPNATIIPVKVLADYTIPALPRCEEPTSKQTVNFGTSEMISAGIDYATDLAIAGYHPMVINMSLGGGELAEVEQEAIDRAIANGVIVVASAGNEGADGMSYPGAYAPVISAGAAGWTKEWLNPTGPTPPRYRLWWLQSDDYSFFDVPEPTPVNQVYVPTFSSRELSGQQLDVLAPGSWVRGPMPGDPGFNHLPWWSHGIGDLVGRNSGNFYYAGGTSMAAPHVSAVAALMLEKKATLHQDDVEEIMKTTALPIPAGSASVYDLNPEPGFYTYSWGSDATGAGLLQADAAVAGS